MAEKRHVQHLRSKVVENGQPKLPEASSLYYGELAINYAKDYETLSIKNENGDIVTFHDEVEVTNGVAPKYNTEIWIDTSASATTEIYTKDQVDSQIGQLNTRVNDVESGYTLQNEKIANVESNLEAVSSKTDSNEANINALNEAIEVISGGEIITIVTEVEKVSGDVETISGEVTTLQNGVNAVSGVVNTINGNVEVNAANIEAISGDVSTINGLVTANANSIETLSGEVATKAEASALTAVDNVLTAHTANTDIHVTTSDKEAWDAKAEITDIPSVSGYADSVKYNSDSKHVEFYHGGSGGTKVFEYDASPFLIDGMVQNVSIETLSGVSYLVISFNTDAGKQDINIPLTDIFNPSNYYDKTAIDGLLDNKADASALTDSVSVLSDEIAAISGDLETVSAKTENSIIIGDGSATTTNDTEIWIDTSEDPSYSVYTQAQVDALIADLQRQIDELKG